MKKEATSSAVKRASVILAKMCATLIISICLGTILMYAVYLLPTISMEFHLKQSIPVFQEEGSYPQQLSWCSSTLDNFTDALMLLTAAYDGEEPPMDKAMNLYFETTPDGIRPVPSLLDHDSEVRMTVTNRYTRYWGGYLVYLKPLLSVMSYQQIRLLNLVLQIGITFLLFFLLKRNGYGLFILPLFLTLGLLPFTTNAQSLTYSDIFYLSMVGACVLLWKWERWRDSEKLLFFFLVLGILTSFFDFLTYPLVSFGIPVCLYFCIERAGNFLKSLNALILFGFAWGMGYAGMWAGKWIAASALTEHDALGEARYSLLVRSGAVLEEGVPIRLLDTIFRNVGEWSHNPCVILFWLFCVVTLLLIFKKDRFEALGQHLIFLPIACLPLVWYIVVRNHSYVHYFFTYKEMVIHAFAIMCFFTKSVSEVQTNSEVHNG